jgi:hypothetical protein
MLLRFQITFRRLTAFTCPLKCRIEETHWNEDGLVLGYAKQAEQALPISTK